MDRTKGRYELFSKTNARNRTPNASHTFTTLNLKRPTCACLLTPCKYRSIVQFCKRGKTKISVRHPHTMCNRTKTKNHKVHFMDRTKGQYELFQKQRSETKHKMHPTHSPHSISSLQHVHAYLHLRNFPRKNTTQTCLNLHQ